LQAQFEKLSNLAKVASFLRLSYGMSMPFSGVLQHEDRTIRSQGRNKEIVKQINQTKPINHTEGAHKTMSNVIASTRNSVRVLGLFAIMMAFAAMFAAGSASAATSTKNGFSTPTNTGTFVVSVIDAKTKELVAGAEIEILDANANVVAKAVVGGNTAETDTVQFTLNQGVYKMYITAEGYQTVETQISVTASQTTKYEAELQQ
jgi:hypothetical protein